MNAAKTLVVALCLPACQSSEPVKLVYPDRVYQQTEWTEDERKKNISIRHIRRSADASTHLIRLKGQEFPHYHDHHDLTVSLLSGKSTIHFQDHQVSLQPGDITFIPKGTLHWAQNTDPVASVVFAVFSPAFDGKDRRKHLTQTCSTAHFPCAEIPACEDALLRAGAVPVMAIVRQLNEATRSDCIDEMIDAAETLKQGETLRMRATTWIASADK